MDILLIIGAVLAVLGIVGSVISGMPGPGFSFLGLLLLYFGKPDSISILALVVFGLVMVLLILMDYVVPLLGAKFSGATKKGLRGAVLGGLIGAVFFPPLGVFLGAFSGACLGELFGGKTPSEAFKAGIGTLAGSAAVIVLQTIYSLVVAGYLFVKVF